MRRCTRCYETVCIRDERSLESRLERHWSLYTRTAFRCTPVPDINRDDDS